MIRVIQRFWVAILIVSSFLTVAGTYFTVELYRQLRTNVEELLPETSRSVRDLDEVARRLKSIDNLAVLAFSTDTAASKRFILDLAAQLETFPGDEITGLEYRIDRELEFFKSRQALFLDVADLMKIQHYVHDRIQYEYSLRNPFTILTGGDILEPKLSVQAIQSKYEKRAQDYSHYPEGFFATPDETKRALLIDVAGKALGIDRVKALKEKVVATIESLHPHSYAPDLEVHYTGSVQEMLEEQDALVEDLLLSTLVVLVLVSAAMLFFFQSFWPTVALVVSLLASTFWTFGAAFFTVGYLNANSAFLGSIVLGNGINFGIIFLARYLEERRIGTGHLRANRTALKTTWKATLTAALAAGLAYGSLVLTHFRGFNQFGLIGLLGMFLCWTSAYTLLPALLSFLDKTKLLPSQWPKPKRKAYLTSGLAFAVSHWPKGITLISAALIAVSVIAISQPHPDLLETNLEHLRSKKSEESGAAFYTQYLNQIFQRFLTPIVILPTTIEKTREIAARLKDLKHKQGASSYIVSVQTIDDFVPPFQTAKIKILHDTHALLRPQILNALSPADHQNADFLHTPEVEKPFTVNDLPPLIKSKFMEKDGSLGKLVLVEPPLSKEIWSGDHLEHFIADLRHATDSVDPGAPVAGGMAITADLVSSISQDGPRATLIALLAVILLVVVIFRDARIISLSLFALTVGMIWFSALIALLANQGFKINFLNFIALPITFGIGVDYGVNIFQRYSQRRSRGIVEIIRETGGAVALSSLTTIIGYSSLLMASNRGFVSFGLLAILGEVSCVMAALVALPAFLLTFKPGDKYVPPKVAPQFAMPPNAPPP